MDEVPQAATKPKKYGRWPRSEWAETLPPEYFDEMGRAVDEMTAGWFSETDVAEGYDGYVRDRYVFGRMEHMQLHIIPWLTAAIPDLKDKMVLEIGCGTGVSTAPLAWATRHVHAFDLAESHIEVAKRRCAILGIKNVTLFTETVDWPDRYFEDSGVVDHDADILICYALLEHLLPMERLKFLIAAWRRLPVGGYLYVGEASNRLWWFDWHSSQLPFADQLPSEIAFLWNDFSDRSNIPANMKTSTLAGIEACDPQRLYRFGRGVSFHEFYVAIGPEAFEVAHAYDMDCSRLPGWNPDYVETLKHQLASVKPPVHPTFAQPRLDLLLRKVGPGRLE